MKETMKTLMTCTGACSLSRQAEPRGCPQKVPVGRRRAGHYGTCTGACAGASLGRGLPGR